MESEGQTGMASKDLDYLMISRAEGCPKGPLSSPKFTHVHSWQGGAVTAVAQREALSRDMEPSLWLEVSSQLFKKSSSLLHHTRESIVAQSKLNINSFPRPPSEFSGQ